MFRPTVSIGIATVDRQMPALDDLITAAEAPLGEAKAADGDRVRMAPDSGQPD